MRGDPNVLLFGGSMFVLLGALMFAFPSLVRVLWFPFVRTRRGRPVAALYVGMGVLAFIARAAYAIGLLHSN